MVIFLRREAEIPSPAGDPRTIPEMNIRDPFVLPYQMWSKYPPLNPPKPLQHPVKHVIASWTNTKECWEEWECVMEVWKLQKSYRDRGMDIPYNFVVGGDSNVYECRGWHAQPEKCDRHPDLEGVSIEIAHIGWKVDDERDPYVGMCHQAWLLMENGITKGYLEKDLDFKPDYDPFYDTPWSEKNKKNSKQMEKEEEEEMKRYKEGLHKIEEEDGTIGARFV